jgi:putative sugar O-methyltransferase
VSVATAGVVFGLPVYNGADHLAEALESLLGQSRSDLAVIVVDNCSTDGTREIALRYAAADPRVVYERNERMVGLVDNWRRAAELAGRHCPEARYFAWASDHDVWHPSWLEALAGELDGHPEAVLAYPRCVRMDDSGAEFPSREHPFETSGVEAEVERLRRAVRHMPAGDMIYSLFRRAALERCPPFPLVVLPDRLYLARLALEGQFRQVDRRLWWRRYKTERTFALGRQRRSFYTDGIPARAYLPWWLAHTALLVRSLGGRPRRLRLGAAHLLAAGGVELARRRERRSRRGSRRRKRRQRFLRRLTGTVRRRLGVQDAASVGTSVRDEPRADPAARVAPTGTGDPAAYATYEAVREEVLRMIGPEPAGRGLLDGLLDASPSFVSELRRHAQPAGGASAEEYRSGDEEARRRHAEKLKALRELGADGLLVGEPAILGGFGFEIDGVLVNRDTLRFYEALIALERSEALGGLAAEGGVVVELGGGWGGFAYQLKTLFPRLRYVIVDAPERFLFSAVYLQTAFPGARAVFWSGDGSDDGALRDADFVFVPEGDSGLLPLDRVDLAVSIGSLERMGVARAATYGEWLHRLGAGLLYSLDRDRSPDDPGGPGLRETLGRWFWLRVAWVLRWTHDQWVEDGPPLAKTDPRDGPVPYDPDRYHHVVGPRRLLLDR